MCFPKFYKLEILNIGLLKHHIDEKFKTFKITLERAITVLETIESKSDKDLPMETIAFLYFLFQENIP